MALFYEFPVKDRKTEDQYKARLNPEDPGRYPKDWEKDGYASSVGPLSYSSKITGFYGFGAGLMGIPNFNLAFYKDPELVRDMVSHWEYWGYLH